MLVITITINNKDNDINLRTYTYLPTDMLIS